MGMLEPVDTELFSGLQWLDEAEDRGATGLDALRAEVELAAW